MIYDEGEKIQAVLAAAKHVVIVQADNPDADSLGSALALEEILGEMGKQTTLYCGVDMPGYLHYLAGWDRVEKDLPKQFDASIIVDASTMTLLEKLEQTGRCTGWLPSRILCSITITPWRTRFRLRPSASLTPIEHRPGS